MSLTHELRRRLRAAADAFVDPSLAEADDPDWEAPDNPGAEDGSPAGAGDDLPRPPDPVEGLRNLVVVVLDSCRYDSFVEAKPKNILKLGEVQRRWSYASWTGPSHFNLLTGLFPHSSPKKVFASEYYKEDFGQFAERLGTDLSWERLLPGLWLPGLLKWGLGYRTTARVSLPVLNPATGINRDFDSYELMKRHDDFAGMVESMRFYVDRPCFHLLNLGETHYPYTVPGRGAEERPHLSGVHGVVKKLGGGGVVKSPDAPSWFDAKMMDRLRRDQVEAVDYVDGLFERLYDQVPENTWIVVTSDHGELFGEGGYFGHGPIQHDRVYEVPFIEGQIR
ncbi:MAG: sulfatase-like hydrolase/transferase [Myxococcota bacterium]|nr:sulfatase-like hydrolase/transferase [Myxococcota bacterium]